MTTNILFEKVGATFVVTFNRVDKRNAFTGAMAKSVFERLKSISEDRSVRVVLIRGNGPDFMDGHDLSLYNGDLNAIQDQIFQKVHFFYTALREMQTMEKPVIAAVHGKVSGAGFNFLLASDLVIASEDTAIQGGFTNHGLVPDGGATFFLPRKVGSARAAQILMLNETIGAKQAEDWGLVTRTVPAEGFEAECLRWAGVVASGATRALGATKRLIVKSFEHELNAQLSLESAFWNTGCKTFDFREAMKAAAAGRAPTFTGT